MATEQLEQLPHVPPDWRDWINEVPTVKTLAVLCIGGWALTPIGMIATSWIIGTARVTDQKAIDAILSMVDKWLDALVWLTGAAVLGVVGKFATTKPEVVRAEGEAKAKTIVAAATAAKILEPSGAPPPGVPETRSSPEDEELKL